MLTLLGTIAGVTDAIMAGILSAASASRAAVDARVKVVGTSMAVDQSALLTMVRETLATQAAKDQLGWWKSETTGLTMVEAQNFDTIKSGSYAPYSQDIVTAMGIPGLPYQGVLSVQRWGSSGIAVYITNEDAPRTFIRRRSSAGWSEWIQQPLPFRQIVSKDESMDTLPDGNYMCVFAAYAERLGLPYNVGLLTKYTTPGGVGVATYRAWEDGAAREWVTRRVTEGWKPWTLTSSAGGGSGGTQTAGTLFQIDQSSSSKPLFDQDHYGSGIAINTQNFPNAGMAWVLHQYSNKTAAFVLDNCASKAAIQINNTRNTTITPTSNGTGAAFAFSPWDTSSGFPGDNYVRWFELRNDLTFWNDTRQRPSFQQVFDKGNILEFKNQSGAVVAAIAHDGAIITTSPNGTKWRLKVSDTGGVSAERA